MAVVQFTLKPEDVCAVFRRYWGGGVRWDKTYNDRAVFVSNKATVRFEPLGTKAAVLIRCQPLRARSHQPLPPMIGYDVASLKQIEWQVRNKTPRTRLLLNRIEDDDGPAWQSTYEGAQNLANCHLWRAVARILPKKYPEEYLLARLGERLYGASYQKRRLWIGRWLRKISANRLHELPEPLPERLGRDMSYAELVATADKLAERYPLEATA